MNTIHLHGRLHETYGGPFDLEVRDAKEAVRALGIQLPGFVDAISEGSWRVVRGRPDSGHHLDEDSLEIGLGNQPLHILPAAEGAGDGAGKVVLGVAMVAAAFFTGGASIAAWGAMTTAVGAMGAGMIIAGASMMMAPTPETGDYEKKEKDQQSFLFNGPVHVNKQGVAVPLIYGETITGSVVISAGIRAEDIPVDGDPDTAFGEMGGVIGKLEGK